MALGQPGHRRWRTGSDLPLSACAGVADAPRAPRTTRRSLRDPGFSDVTQQCRGAKAETRPEQHGAVKEMKGRSTPRRRHRKPRGREDPSSRSTQSSHAHHKARPESETGRGFEQTFLPWNRAEGRGRDWTSRSLEMPNQIHRGTPPPARNRGSNPHVPHRRGQHGTGLAPVRQPLARSDMALARDRTVLGVRVLPRAVNARAQSSGGHGSPGMQRMTRSDRTVHTSHRARGAQGGHSAGVHIHKTSWTGESLQWAVGRPMEWSRMRQS